MVQAVKGSLERGQRFRPAATRLLPTAARCMPTPGLLMEPLFQLKHRGPIGATFGFVSLFDSVCARPCEKQWTVLQVPWWRRPSKRHGSAARPCAAARRISFAMQAPRDPRYPVLTRFMARNEARERVVVEVRLRWGRHVRQRSPVQQVSPSTPPAWPWTPFASRRRNWADPIIQAASPGRASALGAGCRA